MNVVGIKPVGVPEESSGVPNHLKSVANRGVGDKSPPGHGFLYKIGDSADLNLNGPGQLDGGLNLHNSSF
jgi:hypothetical protein